MDPLDQERNQAKRLRQRAEEALQGKPVDLAGLPIEDIQTLLHELQVHQIELALQNDELRHVQHELETSRDRFAELYHFAPAGYCTIDRKGRILEANQTLMDLLGIQRELLLGRSLSDFIHSSDQDAYHLHRVGAFKEKQRKVSEIRLVKEDRTEMYVRLESRVAQSDANQLMVMVSDISERKQAEQIMAETGRQLERSNRELEQFAFIASHDLQEPLRKIDTFGDAILKGESQLDDHTRDYLERMRNAAQRMRKMIDGLLQFSRVNTQGQAFETVDLHQVTDEALQDLEQQIKRTGGRVEVASLPTVEGDPVQLRRLMQNLISNALKFTRPDTPPLVTIYSKITPHEGEETPLVNIYVEDHGIGMDVTHAEQLFQPFHRLVSRSEYEGTGMGLAICRKIVERHGGKISIQSTPQIGTTFIVTLPARMRTIS